MKTTLLTPETDENAVKTAAELIRAGEVRRHADRNRVRPCGECAQRRGGKKIFLAKGRPQDNPLFVHIADFDQIYDLCLAVPSQAKLLADAFWPGPLTMIVPKGECIPDEVSCRTGHRGHPPAVAPDGACADSGERRTAGSSVREYVRQTVHDHGGARYA